MAWKISDRKKAENEERDRKLNLMVNAVKQMTEEQRRNMLAAIGAMPTCAGGVLSPYNSCLLLMQDSNMRLVGGYRQWEARGRQVRKGEKAKAVWIKVSKKFDAAPDATDADGKEWSGFILRHVMFDISQTEPIGAAEIAENAQALPSMALACV